MTTTSRRTAADSLLCHALATTRRIATFAATETTSSDDHERADAVYDLATAADRVLATYQPSRRPRTARPAAAPCPRRQEAHAR